MNAQEIWFSIWSTDAARPSGMYAFDASAGDQSFTLLKPDSTLVANAGCCWWNNSYYVVTPNGDTWNIGAELTGTPAEELSTDKFVTVQVTNVPKGTRVGVWANQVELDNFKADKATIDVVETGVTDVNVATPSTGRHTIYTLGGQRIDAPVSSLGAGIYIIDGVKVKK